MVVDEVVGSTAVVIESFCKICEDAGRHDAHAAMHEQEGHEMDVDREPRKPVLTEQQWTEFDELERRTNANAVLAAAAADVSAPLLMARSHRVSLRVSSLDSRAYAYPACRQGLALYQGRA